MIGAYQNGVMYACIAVLAVIASVSMWWLIRLTLRFARASLRPSEVAVFSVIAGFCCWAAQKHTVLYPRTDPTTTYLIDNGSYVDSDTDTVHIDFRRIIVPDSAMVYVDRIQIGDESGIWSTEYSSTFSDLVLPLEIYVANATNYRWMVYTDWTPGPAVQTNGVWHANWGIDRKKRRYLIPLRTAVRVDGDTIATPKSKEDSHANQ